jgi:hypothetical protein
VEQICDAGPRPTPALAVERAISHARQGRVVVIGSEVGAVLTIPASVLDEAGLAALQGHGAPSIVAPRRLLERLRLSGAVALSPRRGGSRSVLAIAGALASPHASASWFRAHEDGVTVQSVPDGGCVSGDDLEVLAAELAQLAGFGPIALVVPASRPVQAPLVRSDDVVWSALASRDPLEVLGVARLPVEAGEIWAHAVRAWDGHEHLVLTPGRELVPGSVRALNACTVGQVFHSSACGCRRAYDDAVAELVCSGSGAVAYLRSAPAGVPCDRLAGPERSAYERALVAQMVDAVTHRPVRAKGA